MTETQKIIDFKESVIALSFAGNYFKPAGVADMFNLINASSHGELMAQTRAKRLTAFIKKRGLDYE